MRQKIIIITAVLLTFGWIGILDYEAKKLKEAINNLNETVTIQNEVLLQHKASIINTKSDIELFIQIVNEFRNFI
jgi:hypothetical protein